MDLEVGLFKDCGISTTRAGPDDSPDTSSFQFVLDDSCLAGTEGVMLCWSPRMEDCYLVTASIAMLRSGVQGVNPPSYAELSQTLDTGLLAPRVFDLIAIPPTTADGHMPRATPHGDGLRVTPPLADADQQITGPSGSGPGQQVTDVSLSEQGGRFGWLLWAGGAVLAAGLALGGAVLVTARRR